VSYERRFNRGQVADWDEEDFKVSAMARIGKYWKWAECKFVISYAISALQRKIVPPKENGMSLIFYIDMKP
jgi:hypothetical protein